MGILTKLLEEGSALSQFNGGDPEVTNQDTAQSTLHNQYSINGNPNLVGYPSPSQLDLNGETPTKYLDNLPG
jgi:hypothetical protein